MNAIEQELSQIPHFQYIHPQLFTSAQPSPEQLTQIKAYGVDTVLNLAIHQDAPEFEHQDQYCLEIGLNYLQIPLDWAQPPAEQCLFVLDLISHFVKDKGKKVDREIDFYLLNGENKSLCEIKLMGKGNPESADAIIARDSNVFVADTLSQQNKNQCDALGINWIALRDANGYKRFKLALEKLGIPHTDYNGNLDTDLPIIFEKLFK